MTAANSNTKLSENIVFRTLNTFFQKIVMFKLIFDEKVFEKLFVFQSPSEVCSVSNYAIETTFYSNFVLFS